MKVTWEHIIQIPEEVRHTMGLVWSRWEREDLAVEGALDLIIRHAHVRERACQTVRDVSNAVRVKEFCEAIRAAHPALSRVEVFNAAGHFLGLSQSHIRDLFYATKAPKEQS